MSLMGALGVLTITLFLPGVLTNPLNASGWTHWKRSRWSANWKTIVHVRWLLADRPTWAGPATVTFTGQVRRLFDDEGFIAACKPIRDASVRLILGTDDGPRCGHRFFYAQQVRPAAERGVLVEVTPR